MKKFIVFMFVAALFFISPSDISAQIRVSININSQPQWGPDRYDYVEYYYLPEIGIYYYAPKAQFIYRNGNRWVYAYSLPYQYRHVDLYNTYKVVINEPTPYLRHSYYASHYKGYKNVHSKQGTIRDSRDPRYRDVNNHQRDARNEMKPQNRNVQSKPGMSNHQDVRGNVENNGKGKSNQGNNNDKGKKNNHK